MSTDLLQADPALIELHGVVGEVEAGYEKVGDVLILDVLTDEEEELLKDFIELLPSPLSLAVFLVEKTVVEHLHVVSRQPGLERLDVMLVDHPEGDEHLLADGRHEVRDQVVLVAEAQLEQEIVVPERFGHGKDWQQSQLLHVFLTHSR